jgi:methylated-DNA-[protein]-cysteine S-methyltransferase
MRFNLEEIDTPIGLLYVVTDGPRLHAVEFGDEKERLHRLLTKHYQTYSLTSLQQTSDAALRLRDYFDGDLTTIESIETFTNGTAFQKTVWSKLRTIPLGLTVSYGWIAKQIGQPTARRAVGLANSLNPISIVVPCHRVIGSNQKLTGYAGGLDRKQWLLEHEMALTSMLPLAV